MKRLLLTAILAGMMLNLNAQTKARDAAAPEMVRVEGGSFSMGSDSPLGDELPVHNVTVSTFEIGRYEVTVAQFSKFIAATGYKTTADKKGGGNVWGGQSAVFKKGVNWSYDPLGHKVPEAHYNHPVCFISWSDAKAYVTWLAKETGKPFRLPTEAEWEFAASGGRNGKGTKYAGSDNLEDVAWYNKNCLGQDVHPVGGKKPNELGIYDMCGNVAEWCNDYYSGSYFASSPAADPTGPATGRNHVNHGGDCWDDEDVCRISHRFSYYESDFAYPTLGFRVACTVK